MSQFSWPTHEDVIAGAEHTIPGYQGIRPEGPGLIQSAIGSAQNAHYYGGVTDVFQLAAHLIYRLQARQPFIDGNKRTSLLTGLAFLEEHGVETDSLPQEELAEEMHKLAVMGEDFLPQFTEFLRLNTLDRRVAWRISA